MRIENAGKSKKIPKNKFVYNNENDEYTCPGGRILLFSGNQKTRNGESLKKYTTDCNDSWIPANTERAQNQNVKFLFKF